MEIQNVAHDRQIKAVPLPDAAGAVQADGWLHGNCVTLVAGTTQLLVPQQDVVYTGYLQTGETLAGALAMSQDLLPLPSVPQECFVYTAFAGAPTMYWCWNDVRVLIDLRVALHPLPPVVLAPHTPLEAVVTLPDGSHAFYTRAAPLLRFIRQQTG